MTCVWDGIIKKLSLNMSSSNLHQFVLHHNTIINNILWNGIPLSEKQKIENYDRIKEIKNIQNGYDCSTCDPLLIFIAWKYDIDIIHHYNSNAIYYTHDDSDFVLPVLYQNNELILNSKNKLKGHKKHYHYNNNKKKKKHRHHKTSKHRHHKTSKHRHHKKSKHIKEIKNTGSKEIDFTESKNITEIENSELIHEKDIENNIEKPKYKCITFYSNSHHFW